MEQTIQLTWRQRNRERTNELNRLSYARNAEKRRARTLTYYHAHKTQYRDYDRNNRTPEYYRNKANTRRAVLAGVFVDKIVDAFVFERDGWVCQICLQPVDRKLAYPHDSEQMRASIDHIIPLANGGLHSYDNVQCSHLRCNKGKSNRV